VTAASASFPALGTTAVVAVDAEEVLAPAREAVEAEIAAIDRACSRFRLDSDLTRVNARAGAPVHVSRACIDAIDAALTAAVASDGYVVPTVGRAVRLLGYDRDFAALPLDGPAPAVTIVTVPGWRGIELDHAAGTVRVPVGVELDLGATAKALCADRAARAAHAQTGAGVVVSLGGDLAVAGPAPENGWLVRVTDAATTAPEAQLVAIDAGGVATSGTTRRRWTRGGVEYHHLIDPATGQPAAGPWRAVTVAAASCFDANVASTASVVMGDAALDWLAARTLPARLVTHSGDVVTVAGWPAESQPLAGCSS
jgi:thiamine biosynthesis lipoprotein